MSGKQMEGSEEQRQDKARDAREHDKLAGEEGASQAASQQRKHVDSSAGHDEKMDTKREGRQDSDRQSKDEVRPRSRKYGDDGSV